MPQARLGEIVGAEAEELGKSGQFAGLQSGARQFYPELSNIWTECSVPFLTQLGLKDPQRLKC